MKNLGLKLFSLLIAILIAYYVHSDSSEGVIGITVPVELKGLPADLVVISPQQRQVQVSIKGPSFLLQQIYVSPPSFRVKVPPDVNNKLNVTFDRNELGLPAGVRVLSIEPSEMEVAFDTLIKKELAVHIPQSGSLRNGLKLADIVVTPPRVTVTGPTGELATLKSIDTEPLDLSQVSADIERTFNLRNNGRWTEYSASQVYVKVSLVREQEERKFTGLAVEVRSVHGQAFSLQPAVVSVEVSGPKDKVDLLKKEEIVPYIRVAASDRSGTSFAVNVDLPKGVSVVMVDPEKVRVIGGSLRKK